MSGLAYGKQLPAAGGEGEVASECLAVVGARDGNTVGGVGEHGYIGEDVADVRAAQGVCVDVIVLGAQAMDGQAATGGYFDDGGTGEGEFFLMVTKHHDGMPGRCNGHIACNG